jgi:hypothetical protein
VVKELKKGDFYIEADMRTGSVTLPYFNNLQAFWPSLQSEGKKKNFCFC